MYPTSINNTLFAGCLFVGMLLLLEVGRRLGNHRVALDPKGAKQGTSVVNGSIFSLLGLLIAFTFSGAAARFDSRRQLVVEESNAIGTAWLRLDVLPAESASQLRPLFLQYLDSRIEVYDKLPDLEAAKAEIKHTSELQESLWSSAVTACGNAPNPQTPSTLLLPALNATFDMASTRLRTPELHPPGVIYGMLGLFSLAGALLAGFTMAGGSTRSWVHILSFAFVLSITVYVIIDLEYPRLGLIQVRDADIILKDLRDSLN